MIDVETIELCIMYCYLCQFLPCVNFQENLTGENCALRAEIDSVNGNLQSLIQEKLDELAKLNSKILADAELLVQLEKEKFDLQAACSDKDQIIAGLTEEQKRLTDRCTEVQEEHAI